MLRPPKRFKESAIPSFAKTELSKLRFAQLLECTSVMCHRSFVSDGVSFYDGSYRSAEFPFFAKKGWTRPQENAAKLPLIGADGVVVSSYRLSTPTVLISGGLKQLPRLRQQGRRTFSLCAATPSSRRRGIRVPNRLFYFGQLCLRKGGESRRPYSVPNWDSASFRSPIRSTART